MSDRRTGQDRRLDDERPEDTHNGIIRFWCDTYQREVGAKYPFNGGKDGKTVKWLREMYSDDEIRTYMSAFFELDDDFVRDNGHSLPLFRGCLPKVINFVRRKPKQKVMSDAAEMVFRVVGGKAS